MDISKITTNPNNPRTIKDDKFKKLVKSIKENPEFLDARPIVVKDNVVYGGNMRWKALKESGIEIRPNWIKDVTGWTDEAIRKFIVIDNIAYGDNDWDMLANQYEKEELEDWGMDVDKWVDDEVVEDEVPEVSQEEPKSKAGEIYQLGRHRIMCGDSTKIEDVERLMDGKKTDMVFTDPPYGVNIGDKSGRSIVGDDNPNVMSEVVKYAFQNISSVIKDGAGYYICSPQGGDMELMMMMMMRDAGIKCRHQIIWKKDVAVFSMGRLDYDYIHEPILYGWKKSHQFFSNNQTSVWEIPRPKSSKLHPTMKPIELISKAINNSSKQDDIILDLFLGSGSTLIACEQTNRVCYGMEIDPKYCDVIRKRYAKFIGKEEEWEKVTPCPK